MREWTLEFELGVLPKPPADGSAQDWDQFWSAAIEKAFATDDPLSALFRCRLGASGYYAAEWYDRLDDMWQAGLRHVLFAGSGLRLLPDFCCHAGFDTTAADLSRVAVGFAQGHQAESWEEDLFYASVEPDPNFPAGYVTVEDEEAAHRRKTRSFRAGGRLRYTSEDVFDLLAETEEMDVIVCQSFLAALGSATRNDFIERSFRSLRPGGFFVIDNHWLNDCSDVDLTTIIAHLHAIGFHLQPHYLESAINDDEDKDAEAQVTEPYDSRWVAQYQKARADCVQRSKAGQKIALFQTSGLPIPYLGY